MGTVSRAKWAFIGFMTGLLVMAAAATLLPDKVAWAANRLAERAAALKGQPSEAALPAKDGAIEMGVVGVQMSPMDRQPLVVLKEKTGERYLLIGVGFAEANAINVKLREVSSPRPLTHDLMSSLIDALGAKVNSVIIHDLQENTFYAKIVLTEGGRQRIVDSRPSDAIALAVRVKVPIYAAPAVMDKAGVLPDRGERPVVKFGTPMG